MRKMSAFDVKNLNENNYSLPPAVNGKLHGFCELFLEDIKWTTTKSYSLVRLCIKFWGESKSRVFEKVEVKKNFENSKRLASNTASIKKTTDPILIVTYKVCTNHRLFQSYLRNCDPIVVEIFSSKTSDLIGKSLIKIPQELYNLDQRASRITSDIFSSRNFKLGEIRISFDISINYNTMIDMPITLGTLKTKPEKDHCSTNHKLLKSIKTKSSKSENKENLQIVGKKKEILLRDSKPRKMTNITKACNQKSINYKRPESNKSTATSSISEKEIFVSNKEHLKCNSSQRKGNPSLINYLSGLPLSNNEENRILSDLADLSPSQSLIDDMKSDDKNVKQHESLGGIRVNIHVLELNQIGYDDAKNYFNSFSNAKFIFKCALTSKIFKFRESMNFFSQVGEFPSHRIVFNKEQLKSIKLCESNLAYHLNFGFCVKAIDSRFSSTHVLGFCRIDLAEIYRNDSRFFKKCAVLNENDVQIGLVTINIEIANDCNFQDYRYCEENHRVYPENYREPHLSHQRLKTTSHPSTSNDCENHGERNFEHKNMQTDENELRAKNLRKENKSDHRDTEMIDVETQSGSQKSKVYQGILFVEGLRSVKDQQTCSDYFITYEGFWNECQEMTKMSVDCIFNYLKQFAVMFDSDFLRKVQNNFMELKLWEKTNENAEKFIASTKVSLHQFYIAFKDVEMMEHLSTNKLPVISTDTWCNFISPLSNELYCQAKILLAIGSENQIDYLKLSRNLHNLQPPQRQVFGRESERSRQNSSSYDPNAQIKNKLTAFIESLSQKLPEPSSGTANLQKFPTTLISSSNSPQPQLRKTSDLLDSLQKALSQPPNTAALFSPPPELSNNSTPSNIDCIKISVSIEHAANLPKIIVKKCRNNKRKNKGTPPQRSEFEPYTYATFEAKVDHLNENSLPQNAIKSHEGIVYCTKVIRSINPEWNESFEVYVPFDVLRNPQKKFVVKVWRKSTHDPTVIEPSPFQDSVVGFSAIDLSVLLTGLPILSGYYNLVDFSGRSNGQIKVNIKPLEDVNQFRNPSSPLVPFMQPLNIDISSPESSNDGSTVLTRTLKRKFTELDEITQRLRARLFDVTGDENFDIDEEFERDLNTVVDDIEEVNESKEDFGWLKEECQNNGNVLMEQAKGLQEEFNKIIESRPSTSKEQSIVPTPPREITGCSSETSQFAIDDLLKKYDLDTLINPNIFKNLLDPTLANSDSTPTLVPNPVNNDSKNNNQDGNESDVTTISSIISNDQVQMIQKALQRTSLHENSDQSSTRREPDGQINNE